MSNRFAFVAGDMGAWRIMSMRTVFGTGLSPASHLDFLAAERLTPETRSAWILLGLVSNVRYLTRPELTALRAKQEPLGRPAARRAALIPIKKTAEWWELAQDERRAIFEEASHHTAVGLEYLPAVARQLFHCRDINEPFDFLTWFEYAPEHADGFESLVSRLRATNEWSYVEREIDLRLERV
jgi:chlorite dismutase